MSEERVTRSGKLYPPSPSKSSERRSSTDSSSSERVTRSGKRLRTSDSEDESPGSPRKSNPPSPTKKIKMDFSDAARSTKRLRADEEEESGGTQELSPIKETNHDGDRKIDTSPEEKDVPGDDSDPEVSFKESSLKAEDCDMEDVETDNHGNSKDEDSQVGMDTKEEDNKQGSSEKGDVESVPEAEGELVGSEKKEEIIQNKDKLDTVDTSENVTVQDSQNVDGAQDYVVDKEETEETVEDTESKTDDVASKESVKTDSIKNSDDSNDSKDAANVVKDNEDSTVDMDTKDATVAKDNSAIVEKDSSSTIVDKDNKDTTVENESCEKSNTERTGDTDEKSDTKQTTDVTEVTESGDDNTETTGKSNTEITTDQKDVTSAKSKDGDSVDDDKDKTDDVEKMEVDPPQNVTAENQDKSDSGDGNTDKVEASDKTEDEVAKKDDASEQETGDVVAEKDGASEQEKEDKEKEAERVKKLDEERANTSSPDDVIVLSDDSSGPMVNGMDVDSDCSSPRFKNGVKKLSEDEAVERDKLIRRLQEELRNEEAKLLLLKKLRQSQLQPVQVKDQSGVQGGIPGKLPIPRNPNAQPPPLVRGGQQMLKPQQQVMMPPLVRGGNQIQTIRNQSSQGPPPLMLGPRSGVHIQSQMVRPPIVRVGSGSNLVAYSTTPTTYTLQQVGQSQPHQVKVAMQSNTVTTMAQESPASRQAAAKLALRKQLEKTLLQIPPPKPPPPEMHFLPSAANNEFIYLVGLEEVVNRITEELNKEKKDRTPKFIEPFTCSQCKLDFTTVWKRDPKKASAVMCETCVVTNQKKALKAEHTNRLKTAFVKALQQEQEIEQRMSQSVSSTVTANGTQAHTSHTREQLQKVQQEQMRQHHQLLQAHQQQMQRHHVRPVYGQIPQAHITPNITYAYHVPQLMTKPQVITTLAQPSDRQREYLLDMIPSRSMAQTVTWKQ